MACEPVHCNGVVPQAMPGAAVGGASAPRGPSVQLQALLEVLSILEYCQNTLRNP